MSITIKKRHLRQKPELPVEAKKSRKPAKVEKPALLPLVSLREGVVFPHTENVLVFGRNQSQAAIEAAQQTHGHVVIVGQKKAQIENPHPKDMYVTGTLAKLERTLQHEGEIHALVRGIKRVRVDDFTQTKPFFVVTARELNEKFTPTDEFVAELKHLARLFQKTIQSGKTVEFFNFMKLMSGLHSHELVDHVASTLDIPTAEKQRLLEELDVNKRIKRVTAYLSREQHILNLEQKISDETKKQIDERMRENILRERLQAIQKELGELDGDEDDLNELAAQLAKKKMPTEVHKKVSKEMRRLRQMSPMHSEYQYLMSWVETVLELPWGQGRRSRMSLSRAAAILAKQHYGLEKVKERVLEYLAVMKLQEKNQPRRDATAKPESKDSKDSKTKSAPPGKNKVLPTILCFVGPPGVGKTSIGRSIAEALGRKFVKVSLGGIRDEAELRGHRRTYVGAMPGRIMQGIAQAGTSNPVFMLDEIDKLGNDYRGDPSAALLEALDPEQNFAFSDHYLGVPYDLSPVIFIATANVLHTIPPALRDRLEVVEYSGYTHDEKFRIAQDYLWKQAVTGSGLKPSQLRISAGALHKIIGQYTKESGVRGLKRELAKVARKAAYQIAQGTTTQVRVSVRQVADFLGPVRYLDTVPEKEAQVGLVNGLAYTSVGGEVLQIEAAVARDSKKAGITLTGQLGEVMKESAQAALTYVRSHAGELGLKPSLFDTAHVHIHVPEGATPKDGPSAGLAMATVLVSAFSGRAVPADIAMTGEVTLRGRALGIGGLKEKMIAAHRAGIKKVFLPADNVKDLVEIPNNVQDDLELVPVKSVREILQALQLQD